MLESGEGALWGCDGSPLAQLWTEIARDRELRERQNQSAARVQRQVARELETDAARARQTDDREAKAREKERIEAERLAGLAEADQERGRRARVDELAAILKNCVSTPRSPWSS